MEAPPSLMSRPAPVGFSAQFLAYLVALYAVTVLVYRTTVWFTYGGWATSGNGQPPFWDGAEFMASAGVDFCIRLVLSLPLMYFVLTRGHLLRLSVQVFLYSLVGVAFVGVAVPLATAVKQALGWVDVLGGNARIWLYYTTALFYWVQLGAVLALVYVRKYQISVWEKQQSEQDPKAVGRTGEEAQLNAHFPPDNLVATTVPDHVSPHNPNADVSDAPLSGQDYPAKIVLTKGNRQRIVAVDTIRYVEAYGDYTKVYTLTEAGLSNLGITALLAKLDPQHFCRVHRSFVVNLAFAEELVRQDRHHAVRLDSGTCVKVSESYYAALRARWIK